MYTLVLIFLFNLRWLKVFVGFEAQKLSRGHTVPILQYGALNKK
jgi:hypothetical protein